MALPFYNWSRTAASNATADATVNWAEGMAPSAVNDSARAMMASTAAFRDDTSGALVTGGTSTAYTLTTNQVFASKALMNGAEISFTVNATNGASPTLNVDGLGGDPITLDGTNAVPTGTLIAGSVYSAVYYNSGNSWRLKDFYQLPFTVPLGGMIDYVGTTAPNSSFVLPFGQAISRTTYASLFALTGTTFGTGDGSTTFNIPDLRGRVVAGYDNMGGPGAGRLNGSLWASVGAQTTTLITNNLPAYTPAGSISASLVALNLEERSASSSGGDAANTVSAGNGGGSALGQRPVIISGGTVSATFTGSAQGGISTPISVLQPTAILNKIIRII